MKIVALAAALGLAAGCSAGAGPAEEAGGNPGEVEAIAVAVHRAELTSVARNISLTGRLRAEAEAHVVSAGGGEIVAVHVKTGDMVQKGQRLVDLDMADQIRQLEQQVAQAEAALAAVTAATAEAELALSIAQREYDRMEPLYREGAISRQQWEQVVDNLERAKLAVEQQVPAQRQQSEAAVEQARRQLESVRKSAVVTAPIAGEVAAVHASVGNFAAPGNPLVSIIKRDRLEVHADLTDSQVVQVKQGSQVQVDVPALPGESFAGVVEEVGLFPDAQTGRFPVKIAIPNPDLRLRPGMYAEITVPVEVVEEVVVIPVEAVITRGDDQVVFVIIDNVAHQRVVATGLNDGTNVEIQSGVEPGEMVVVVGQHYLADGAPVLVSNSQESPADQGDA